MEGLGGGPDSAGSGDSVVLPGSGLATGEGAADVPLASDGSHATTAPPTAAKATNAARPPISWLFTLRSECFRRRRPAGFRLCAVTVITM